MTVSLFKKAEFFMVGAFAAIDKRRKYTNEPYTAHCFEVANLTRMIRASDEVCAAALLHDVVEDTKVSIGLVKEMFGIPVATLVHGMTKPSKNAYPNRAVRNVAYNQQLAEGDSWLHTIKAADIIANLNHFGAMLHYDAKFAIVYAEEKRETLKYIQKADALLLQMAANRVNTAFWMIDAHKERNQPQ